MIFSLIQNFCFGTIFIYYLGYLLAWAYTSDALTYKLNIFVNIGIAIGYLLGIAFRITIPIVVLPCIAVGLNIYTAIFICLPQIYTDG